MHISTRLTTHIPGLVYKTEFPSGHKIQVLQTCRHHPDFKPPKHVTCLYFPLAILFLKQTQYNFFLLAYAHLYLWGMFVQREKRLHGSLCEKEHLVFPYQTSQLKLSQRWTFCATTERLLHQNFKSSVIIMKRNSRQLAKTQLNPAGFLLLMAAKAIMEKMKITPKLVFCISCYHLFFFFPKLAKDSINQII